MEEETRHKGRIMLKSPHKRTNFMRGVLRRIWQLPRMYGKLQRVVEIFVGIVFRGIRGQEENLDFLLVFFQPSRNKFSMMHLQVIQNQEYFSVR